MSTKQGKKNTQNVTQNNNKKKRNNKGPGKRQPNFNKNKKVQGRVEKGGHYTDNPEWQKAQGARGTIMVDVPVDATAAEAFPVALMSVALSLGFNNSAVQPIYYAYFARMTDFINLLKSQTPVVPARLTYENIIDATYLPKDVPFKTGTIATSWSNTGSIQIPNLINVRGYNYYFWVPSNVLAGVWRTQVAPSVPVIEDAVPILSKAYNYISSEMVKHLRYTTSLDLDPEYKRDMSGFGANSSYYGTGNSPAGADVKSAEWEGPVKAPTLSCLSSLQPGSERVGRYLKVAGGDSTYVNGVALYPGFEPEIYKTKINPVFCALDLDEIVLWLQSWYVSLIAQAQKTTSTTLANNNLYDYYLTFPYSAQAFRIAVRQTVLAMFVQSQAACQFLTYSPDARGFEPFRVGTNCYSKNKNTMVLPLLMVENLRMLLSRFIAPDSAIKRTHNQQVYSPVWGIYKALNRVPINLEGSFWIDAESQFETAPMFQVTIAPEDPGIIDGVNPLGLVIDLNSPIVDEIVADWNDRIDQLQFVSCTTSYAGGASNGTFLTCTRFAHYNEVDMPLSSMTRLQKKFAPSQFITKRKVTRQMSKTKVEVGEEEVYIPANASLFTQSTDSYSSMSVITETLKMAFQYFVLPTVVVETDGTVPTARQVRTGNLQCNLLEYPKLDDTTVSINTRGTKLLELGKRCAPGIASAGKADELMAVLQALSDAGAGGFFGNMLGMLIPEIAPITGIIPF